MSKSDAWKAYFEADQALRPLKKKRKEALKHLRKVCLHPIIYECKPMWEHEGNPTTLLALRICVDCGAEEESWGGMEGLAWKALDARPNDSLVKVVNRDVIYANRKQPGGRYEVAWCCGDRNHPGHACPVEDLTKGRPTGERRRGTRCKSYEGRFE